MKKLLCSLFALSAVSTAMAQEVNIKLLGYLRYSRSRCTLELWRRRRRQIWFLCANRNLCERCA